MISVETKRPVYSNAIGDKLKRSPEKKVSSQNRRIENTIKRKSDRSNRKAKRNAKRLIRLENRGQKSFFYPLTKIFNKKKKHKDGTTIDIPAENTIVVSTKDGKTAQIDKNEVAKALNIPASQVTPALVQEAIVNIPASSAPIAVQETGAVGNPDPVLAIPIKDADVTITDNGDVYLTDDTQNQNQNNNVADEERVKNQKIKIGKIIVISGIVLVIAGTIFYFYNKSAKKS